MLMNIFDAAFSAVAPIVALLGLLLCCFYLTVMFDDKGTYNATGRGFLKWLGNAGSSAVTEMINEETEKKTEKED